MVVVGKVVETVVGCGRVQRVGCGRAQRVGCPQEVSVVLGKGFIRKHIFFCLADVSCAEFVKCLAFEKIVLNKNPPVAVPTPPTLETLARQPMVWSSDPPMWDQDTG